MNEIFAIDPYAPDDLKDIKAMLEKFGLSNGRFIANYPDDWSRMLSEHAQNLQGLDRSRFVRLLDIHKDALIAVNLHFKRAKSWIENASEAKDTKKDISRVLAATQNPFGIETLHKFLWEDDLENNSRGAHIPMTTDAYKRAVRPLFQNSTEIHLVDPFFQLRGESGGMHKGRVSVLREFLIEADSSDRCEIFKIHFNRDDKSFPKKTDQESRIENDLNNIFEQIKLDKLSIEYDIQNEMAHGRYIFSIKGGLHFDHGFIPISDKKNHVHWLTKAELEPLFRRYI